MKKIFWIIALVALAFFIIPPLFGYLVGIGNSFQKTGADVGSTVNRAIEAGIVRRECEKYKADLDARYESAKNTYTQSVVLQVQELSTNAKLAKDEVAEVNKVAFESIFGKTDASGKQIPPSGDPSSAIITSMAKYSQDFAKPDPELRRGVAKAITSGRSKFEASMKEVIDIKTQFKKYAEENSVYLPNGQPTIKVLEFNGCIPDLDGDGKADAALFFAKYDPPSSVETNKAFDNKLDGNVLSK